MQNIPMNIFKVSCKNDANMQIHINQIKDIFSQLFCFCLEYCSFLLVFVEMHLNILNTIYTKKQTIKNSYVDFFCKNCFYALYGFFLWILWKLSGETTHFKYFFAQIFCVILHIYSFGFFSTLTLNIYNKCSCMYEN